MALEPIIDALTWLVQEAEPTAKVWPADRIAVEPPDVQSIFGVANSGFSKGWSVYYWAWDRTNTREDWSTNSESIRVHSLRLQGYMEVLDAAASRVVFRQATENVCTALRALPYTAADLVIDGLPEAIQEALPDVEAIGPPSVTQDGLALLGEVYLCHAASITLMVTERVPITP